MNRRKFLNMAGAGLSSRICFPHLASALCDGAVPGNEETSPNHPKAYGSGHFGEWITDESGLPAYRYTCDQLTDPHAQTPVHKEWIGPTDHLHQVGNDRVVAVASNFGYVQHAWPLYTAAKHLGLSFHQTGLRLKPRLPLDEYEFKSTLLGFSKSKDCFSGWYAPLTAGDWEIEIQLPDVEQRRFREVHINGQAQPLKNDTPAIRFRGESRPGSPLKWELCNS